MSKVRRSFIPDGEQEGGGVRQQNIKNSLLEVLLKLASVHGYNLERQIRGRSGDYMTGTDVALLTSYTLQPDKLIRGKQEFVQLLLQAGVSPGLIVNENMKIFLPGASESPPAQPPPPPPAPTVPQPTPPGTPQSLPQSVPQSSVTPSEPRVIYNMPSLQGPFPETPPPVTRKRGRPRVNLPPPPPLNGPFPIEDRARNRCIVT